MNFITLKIIFLALFSFQCSSPTLVVILLAQYSKTIHEFSGEVLNDNSDLIKAKQEKRKTHENRPYNRMTGSKWC